MVNEWRGWVGVLALLFLQQYIRKIENINK